MSREDDLVPVEQLTGLDGMFAKTNMVLLILFCFCCQPIPLILGILGLALCKDPRAKQNALVVTILSAVLLGTGIVSSFAIGPWGK